MKSGHIRLISTLVAFLFALPFSFNWATGFYNWLSPFILLNSFFLLKSLVILNILGFVVLGFSCVKISWFCRCLCPVGLGCDMLSKISPIKSSYLKKVPAVARWIYIISLLAALLGIPVFIVLDPMAIFNGFFSVFAEPFSWIVLISMLGLPFLLLMHLIFPNLWCTKICPLGGLMDDIYLLRRIIFRKTDSINYKSLKKSRRLFLAGGAGIAAGIVIPKFLHGNQIKKLKPPASLHEPLFSTVCIRCGSCIKACPGKILFHDTSGWLSWMTPELTFENGGYCHEDCNLCGTVCPSGSISPFSIEAKKNLYIATVEIESEQCLLTRQKECDRCKAVCKYNAIEIRSFENSIIMAPEVNLSKCVGCGACSLICPAECIQMVPV